MTEGEKIVESIFGLILGTIFIFCMGHWNAPVTRAEARDVTATFSSFQESRKRGEVREIILRFDDHEQMYIDGQCIDEALCAEIEALEPHTVVRLWRSCPAKFMDSGHWAASAMCLPLAA